METPRVSIIIPVYNLEKYLGRCLDSVTGQSLREIEIICIDDASEDNSLEILEKYQARDTRIRVASVEKSGQGIIRNMGIAMARGEFIGFVDGDDTVTKTMFEELYHAAAEAGSEIAFCHAACYNDEGRKIKFPYYDKERKQLWAKETVTTYSNEALVTRLTGLTAVCWNKIYKREFLLDNGIEFAPGVIHEDLPFFFKAILNCRQATLVRKRLYNYSAYRMGSTTQAVMSMSTRMIETFKFTEEKIAKKLEKREIAQKFFEYKILQLLSFLSYAFNRHELSRFTKLRFFCVVKAEFERIRPEHLQSLNNFDYFHFRAVKNRHVKLFRTRSLAEAIVFHTQDTRRFLQFLKLVSRIPAHVAGSYYRKARLKKSIKN